MEESPEAEGAGEAVTMPHPSPPPIATIDGKKMAATPPSASSLRWSLLGRFISSKRPAPAVCWISKPKDSVASFSLYDPKDCVVRACGSLFSSIEQQHVLNWIHVFKEQWILPIPSGWKSRVEISKQERDSGVGCVQRTGKVADKDLGRISRRPAGRFNVIHCSPVPPPEDDESRGSAGSKHSTNSNNEEVVMQYAVSSNPDVVLTLRQRKDADVRLNDFIVSQKHNIDSTGLVCLWPAEEILTYYCISRPELFRNKRVVELGAGYGLAGLAIAACTDAAEVLLTDGNPQVVEYIKKNITANCGLFGGTKVRTCALHWSRHQAAMPGLKFDLVVAADCTFFKDFHLDLAHTIKGLLGTTDDCQAILFNPQRGDSLDRFIKASQSAKLQVDIHEHYDAKIWELHKAFVKNDAGSQWPNYDEDHCYPLLLSIRHLKDGESSTGCFQDLN